MHTARGNKYYPFAPRVKDVDIQTIAHHFATICRWNGAPFRKSKGTSKLDQDFFQLPSIPCICDVMFAKNYRGLYVLLHHAAEAA